MISKEKKISWKERMGEGKKGKMTEEVAIVIIAKRKRITREEDEYKKGEWIIRKETE